MSTDPDDTSPEDDHEAEDHDHAAYGEVVVNLETPEGRISVSAPVDADPDVMGRLMDLAVEAIGKLKVQMQ